MKKEQCLCHQGDAPEVVKNSALFLRHARDRPENGNNGALTLPKSETLPMQRTKHRLTGVLELWNSGIRRSDARFMIQRSTAPNLS
jgi:hypothetical protein